MADQDDKLQTTEEAIRATFGLGSPSDRAIDNAKSLIAFRTLDQHVGALLDRELAGVRGPDDDSLTFVWPDVSPDARIDVSFEPNRLHLQIAPSDATVSVEGADAVAVELDAVGGASVGYQGAAQVRLTLADGTSLVTPGFIVPAS